MWYRAEGSRGGVLLVEPLAELVHSGEVPRAGLLAAPVARLEIDGMGSGWGAGKPRGVMGVVIPSTPLSVTLCGEKMWGLPASHTLQRILLAMHWEGEYHLRGKKN